MESSEIKYISPENLTDNLAPLLGHMEATDRRIVSIEEAIVILQNAGVDVVPPVPDPVDGAITVDPSMDLQRVIDQAGSNMILLKDGVYPPVYVRGNTHLRAINPGKVRLSGLVDFTDDWSQNGDVYYKAFTTVLHQHPAHQVHGGSTPSDRGLAHREAMIPHLLVHGKEFMKPVHTQEDFVNGTFMLDGTAANPKGIWAKFPGGQLTDIVYTSTSGHIISTESEDVDNVKLEGLIFTGCANTVTRGSLNFPSQSNNWEVTDCIVDLSSGEGVIVRGDGHILTNVISRNHGVTAFSSVSMNNCRLINCEGSASGWKPGVDLLWHAGNKFTKSSNNYFQNWTSRNMNGAGLWFDIYCIDNIIDGFTVENSRCFGVHLEHNSFGSEEGKARLVDGVINGVRGYEGIGSGLQIQFNIRHWFIDNIDIANCEEGAVYYKKKENRGFSGYNVFSRIRHENNGNNNRWAIQGDENNMPDQYIDMDRPNITNWS